MQDGRPWSFTLVSLSLAAAGPALASYGTGSYQNLLPMLAVALVVYFALALVWFAAVWWGVRRFVIDGGVGSVLPRGKSWRRRLRTSWLWLAALVVWFSTPMETFVVWVVRAVQGALGLH